MLRKLLGEVLLRGLHVFSEAHQPVLHCLLDCLQHNIMQAITGELYSMTCCVEVSVSTVRQELMSSQ